MGLIKTAIMTGGGIYAVNKLAKTASDRHPPAPQNPNAYPRDNQYWGPPGPPPRGDNYYGPPPPRQDSYYQNQRQYNSGAQGQDTRGYAPDEKAFEGDYQNQRSSAPAPPAYYQQQQYEAQEYGQAADGRRGASGMGDMAGMANMAMDFVGSSSGRKDGKGKKASEMVSGFLGK